GGSSTQGLRSRWSGCVSLFGRRWSDGTTKSVRRKAGAVRPFCTTYPSSGRVGYRVHDGQRSIRGYLEAHHARALAYSLQEAVFHSCTGVERFEAQSFALVVTSDELGVRLGSLFWDGVVLTRDEALILAQSLVSSSELVEG